MKLSCTALLGILAVAGCSVTRSTSGPAGTVRDTLLLDISTTKFWSGVQARAEVATLHDGREVEFQSVPHDASDPAPWFQRAFAWEDEEQDLFRSSVASSLEALDQESLYRLYLDESCIGVSPERVRKRAPFPPSRFYVSPNKRLAIYQPKALGGNFDLAGLLVDLRSRKASPLFCRIRPVVTKWSPDGRFIAYGTHRDSSPTYEDRDPEGKKIEVTRDPYFPTETLSLVDVETGKVMWRARLADRVQDLTWARNSDKIVVLEKSGRVGLWPWELLFALAGHPVPYDTFSMEWFDRSGVSSGSTVVVRGLTYGSGRLRWSPAPVEELSATASR
jgi:hypothetical protein